MGRTITLSLVALALVGCASTDVRSEKGFTPLFDGTTLTGWTQRGGAAVYTVEDGAIVGESRPNQPNTFLCTDETFADFILELDFKVDPELNSGIQIRSESKPDYQDGRVHGYQVEIDATDRAFTGGIYDEARRGRFLADPSANAEARAAFKQNDWNHFRIEAIGDTFRTWLNDVPVVTLNDSMTPEGFIALQVHGVGERVDPLRVMWRDIRIKRINSR